MLLLALVACSNLSERSFYEEGGARYMTGSTDAGGGDDTAGDTADSGQADDGVTPMITGVAAAFTGEDDDGNVYIDIVVSYTDAQDDLLGGDVNFRYAVGGGSAEALDRNITDEEAYDTVTEAGLVNGRVELQIGPIDTSVSHTITDVSLEDAAGHQSDGWDVGEVAGR